MSEETRFRDAVRMETTRLGTTTIAAFLLVLVGLGLVEALDQFGASPVLPALFPLLPLGIAVVAAIQRRSLAFDDLVRGGSLSSRSIAAATVAAMLSPLLLVAGPISTGLGGREGLVLIGLAVLGLALSQFGVVPSLRAEGGATLAETIGRRFGAPARAVAAIVVVLTCLAMLMAEAGLGGVVASRMLGVSDAGARNALLALAGFAALIGGLGAGFAIGAILLPIVVIAFLVPIGVVSWGESPVPFPWIGLLDPSTLDPASRISPTVFLAVALMLVLGLAVLPTLVAPAAQAGRRPPQRADGIVAILLTLAVLLVAPSYAVYGRLAGIDPTTDPAGLLLAFPDHVGLSATPSVLLIAGLLAAGLIAAILQLSVAAATIGHDLYGAFAERRTPEARRLFIARLAMIALVVLVAWLLQTLGAAETAMWAGLGLSLAVAALAPAVMFGGLVRHHRALAATASILIGGWLTIADFGGARLLPTLAAYAGMQDVTPTILGPTGWFGLPVGISGIIGFGYGLAVLLLLPMVLRFPWKRSAIELRLLHRRRQRARRRARAAAAMPPTLPPQPAPAVLALPAPSPPPALPPPAPVLALPAPAEADLPPSA